MDVGGRKEPTVKQEEVPRTALQPVTHPSLSARFVACHAQVFVWPHLIPSVPVSHG